MHGQGGWGIAGSQGTVRELTGWSGPFPDLVDKKISGATFSSINTSFLGVYVEDQTRAWAVGTSGTVVHSGPTRAMTWYQVATGGPAWRAVWSVGGTTFLVGDKGSIRMYLNLNTSHLSICGVASAQRPSYGAESMSQEDAKRAAARAAARRLPEAGIIGLGTGSTAKLFIEEVGRLVAGGRDLKGVPTSADSRKLAESLGIPLLSDDGPWEIDVCVDGADEVDGELALIKGGGAALLREKIVNQASRMNIIIVDESKLSKRLGEKWPVPVEVVKFGHGATAAVLGRYGKPVLRTKAGAAVVTDAGNYIYDLITGPLDRPDRLETSLHAIPGVVEVGLFLTRVSLLLVASANGVVQELSPAHGSPSHWAID